MTERPSELAWTADGMVAQTRLRGSQVLSPPLPNWAPRSPWRTRRR